MESKAKLFGHATHPILIVFPLGLPATAVIFDVICSKQTVSRRLKAKAKNSTPNDTKRLTRRAARIQNLEPFMRKSGAVTSGTANFCARH